MRMRRARMILRRTIAMVELAVVTFDGLSLPLTA